MLNFKWEDIFDGGTCVLAEHISCRNNVWAPPSNMYGVEGTYIPET